MHENLGAVHVGRVFRALSNPTRLRMLNLLLTGEICVSDIATTLRIPQRTALRHLADLRRMGFLDSRRDEHGILLPAHQTGDRFSQQAD
jgi:DNA-binding transcriptional ArsR family regulator